MTVRFAPASVLPIHLYSFCSYKVAPSNYACILNFFAESKLGNFAKILVNDTKNVRKIKRG